MMWKRLAILWAVTGIVVYFLFFYRIETHAVMLDMPSNATADPRQVEIGLHWFMLVVGGCLSLALLGVFIWLNIRIVRRYRGTAR